MIDFVVFFFEFEYCIRVTSAYLRAFGTAATLQHFPLKCSHTVWCLHRNDCSLWSETETRSVDETRGSRNRFKCQTQWAQEMIWRDSESVQTMRDLFNLVATSYQYLFEFLFQSEAHERETSHWFCCCDLKLSFFFRENNAYQWWISNRIYTHI